MNLKREKGITLIALVITIIVLLILAGVTINMVLGDDGIIANAQKAKESNKKAEEKDMVAIAKAEAATLKYAKQDAMKYDDLEDTFTNLTNETYHNSVAKVVEGVPIPVGFAHVQGTTKDEGLVVVDVYGNEFVWVPVSDITYFAVLQEGSATNYRGQLWATSTGNSFGTKNTTYDANSGLREPAIAKGTSYDGHATNIKAIKEEKYNTLLEQFQAEYNAMVESVKNYGGFYVGRYETGWDVKNGVVVSKPGEPMTADTLLEETWATSNSSNANKATWYGLYAKQKELYNKDTDSVVSGMIYGAEWDAIMNWMLSSTDENVKTFVTNSSGKGNYSSKSLANTGKIGYDVNNIYDLAGNYYEWTQEVSSTGNRVTRGGYYLVSGSSYPASSRNSSMPTNTNGRLYSSRLQLYIK